MQRLGFWSTACSFLLILLNSIHPESSHMFSFHHSFESGSKPGRGKVFQCLQQPMKVICLIIEVMEGKKGSYTHGTCLAWNIALQQPLRQGIYAMNWNSSAKAIQQD